MPNSIFNDSAKIIDNDPHSSVSPDDAVMERYKADTKSRNRLANITMGIIVVWLLLVLAIIFFTGRGKLNLSDIVICTLLGTTTINVLGLAVIVLQGFFKYMNQDPDIFFKKDN